MLRPTFRTGSRGLPCALPRFQRHGDFARLDASACNVPPGAVATVEASCLRADGTGHVVSVDLVRGGNGRAFFVCPFCHARRAHLYAFARRMERPGWTATVPPYSLACRACHGIKYASQYGNRPRDLSRIAASVGACISPAAYRALDRAEHRAAVRDERTAAYVRRAMERVRAYRARAERERRARRRAEARAGEGAG